MPLQNSDLFFVQRGNTGFKMQAVALSDYIAATNGSLKYQGNVDATQPVGTQLKNNPPVVGDIYINNVTGIVSSAGTNNTDRWIGIAGENISNGQRVVWDGSVWSIVGTESVDGVESIQAGDNIEVNNSNPSSPIVSAPGLVKISGDTMTGQLELPGGGGNTEALQKQEVESLISAIPLPPGPDLTPYVKKSGSNMTGDLTLGTSNIVLDADAGLAEFKGQISCESVIESSRFGESVQLGGSSDGALLVGGSGIDNKVKIGYDGSAEFKGNVQLPGGGGDTEALQKQEIESLIATGGGGSGVGNLQQVTDNGNTTTTGATFGGQVTSGNSTGTPSTSGASIGDSGYLAINHFNRQNQNCIVISDTLAGEATLSINGSGSATFAGDIQTGERIYRTGKTGFYLDSTYILPVKNGTESTDGSVNFGSEAYPWGSATFAGNMALDFVEGTTGEVFRVKSGSDRNILFNGDGSATFTNGFTLNRETAPTSIRMGGSDTYAVWLNNSNFILKYDGSATFATKVTAADFDSNHPSDSRFGRFNWAGIRFTDISGNNLIRLDADGGGAATFAGTGSFGNEVYIKASSASTQRYLNFGDADSSTYRASLRRDAWYLGTAVSNVGDVTPGNANIVLNMNGAATFKGNVTTGDTSTGCQWFNNGSGIGRLNGTQAWYLNNTGDATFNGTVTASNITAFKSRLATAVIAATTLATLKQAILDAIGDL